MWREPLLGIMNLGHRAKLCDKYDKETADKEMHGAAPVCKGLAGGS